MDPRDPVQVRKRGRPRALEPKSSTVLTRLPDRHYDRLIRLANRRGETVSATVRQVIILTMSGMTLDDPAA
jgi:hypothetical protein